MRSLRALLLVPVWLLIGSPVGVAGDQAAPDSVAAGQAHYATCAGCHSPGYHRTGPKHCGVLGRPAASEAGFAYSAALRASGIRWDRTSLDRFLKAPLKRVPGTSMTFAGIDDARIRARLIDYLSTLNSSHRDCKQE